VIGDVYLERGEPVTVLVAWRGPSKHEREEMRVARAKRRSNMVRIVFDPDKKSGPRNVLIQRADGSLIVRPFRGLRKPKPIHTVARVPEKTRKKARA